MKLTVCLKVLSFSVALLRAAFTSVLGVAVSVDAHGVTLKDFATLKAVAEVAKDLRRHLCHHRHRHYKGLAVQAPNFVVVVFHFAIEAQPVC